MVSIISRANPELRAGLVSRSTRNYTSEARVGSREERQFQSATTCRCRRCHPVPFLELYIQNNGEEGQADLQVIEEGNRAAHCGNVVADRALLRLKDIDCVRYAKDFDVLYLPQHDATGSLTYWQEPLTGATRGFDPLTRRSFEVTNWLYCTVLEAMGNYY